MRTKSPRRQLHVTKVFMMVELSPFTVRRTCDKRGKDQFRRIQLDGNGNWDILVQNHAQPGDEVPSWHIHHICGVRKEYVDACVLNQYCGLHEKSGSTYSDAPRHRVQYFPH